MEALIQLCDLIVQNPTLFADKLSWICSRCPNPESLLSGSSRITQSQLNAVLVIARFLSKCSKHDRGNRPKSVVIGFLQSIPASFDRAFWPHSFGNLAISTFFTDFFDYIVKATEFDPDLAEEIAGFMGQIVISAAFTTVYEKSEISRLFLASVSKNFLPILQSDAEKLAGCILEQFPVRDVVITSGTLSIQSSPSPGNEASVSGSSSSSIVSRSNGGNIMSRSSVDQFGVNCNDPAAIRQLVAVFEDESIEGLEKQELGLRLLGHIVEKVPIKAEHLEQIRAVAKDQLQLLSYFLKIRKREWTEQGSFLKDRINTKLSVYKASVWVQVKSLASLDSDGKSSKRLLLETLASLIEAAEACLLSVWRKLRVCEVLFSSLLNGISQIAVTRGGQLLRVLLIRLKSLVLTTCAQADTWGNTQGTMFESVIKTSCEIIEFGWNKDRAPVDTFIMALASNIRNYDEQDSTEKAVIVVQLNVISMLADFSVSLNKSEVVDMILPLFIESLEEGNASTPSLLRLRLLDAVSRMASLGFEKSYRETVVLMTRSYLKKLSTIGSEQSKTSMQEATTERLEILPAGFLRIASSLTSPKLRVDCRHRLLSLCSDVGLAAESKSGRSGADFLGPLLPAVAEICSDFDPTTDVDPSLLKLFRNLWFYVALFGLAPPIQNQVPKKSTTTTLNSEGSMSAMALQAVAGPYLWNSQWSSAVQHIAKATPSLVVSPVKWLEDELELNALHNPSSGRGIGNEKAAVAQRTALSVALGGRVEVAAMNTITGVKATYLLAVAFLEIIRFSSNGGILNGGTSLTASRSAFSCVFEYLKTPNLTQAVLQCLTAIVNIAFETAVSWLDDRILDNGDKADLREATLSAHACFLIKSMSEREEHIRENSEKLLNRLKDRFPQILWHSSCLDSLLFSVHNDLPSAFVNDPAWVATVRSMYQKVIRDWISNALSYAPCTTQGLLQDKLCKVNTWQRTQHTPDVISLLSEMRIGTGKIDCWMGTRTANIPAVLAAAAAASGANLKLTDAFNLEVLSTSIGSATIKNNIVGEIAGMRRFYESIGGFNTGVSPIGFVTSFGLQRLRYGTSPQEPQPESESFNEILLTKFIRLLQQFVNTAEKGGEVDSVEFRETCSRATALLISNMESDSRSNLEGFSQLLRLLCWCPAYISTPDAVETGVFIWTWLVSAAPQVGSLVLAELVDAWLWTVDTKRGIFASEVRYSGPAAILRPHLAPGEPEVQLDKDPIEGIIAHRLWLGFFIDRFEVVRHDSIEQLLLLGRMLQGTLKFPFQFSRHPAATGTFFTFMLLGLKFCSCQSQRNVQRVTPGFQLVEDRIYRASLGWFAYEPEWYDTNYKNFALSEAQSLFLFLDYLLNERVDVLQSESSLKGRGRENGNSFSDMLIRKCNDPLAERSISPYLGMMENYTVGREKRKQLLSMLCQHEADRLDVWAQPLNSKENTSRIKISSEKWIDYAKTAFAVDPRIAFTLVSRFRTNPSLRAEVTQLVQLHILDIRCVPEALPYFVTPKAVDENSAYLQQLPHWAACSITQALEFLTPSYKGHPRVMAYVLRVLESYPPERVTFFMPQLVQALRYDKEGLVEGYLLRATQRSDIFAHILIWHLQGETCSPELEKEIGIGKNGSFQKLLPIVRQHIIDGFSLKALDVFQREFDFFDKVTSISGVLFPLTKEERRAGIRRELEKIEINGNDLYLPTAPNKLVRGIQLNSGIPLQSAAKVPIMITFDVVDRDGNQKDLKPQACIFKVGDDCRQDVLALQVISLLRDIFEAVGLNLYLFPYGVLPTGPERGIIEVIFVSFLVTKELYSQ
ncbi:hypothetical protein GIB67_003933, partial [Kingdonia uniflora]